MSTYRVCRMDEGERYTGPASPIRKPDIGNVPESTAFFYCGSVTQRKCLMEYFRFQIFRLGMNICMRCLLNQ